MAEYVDLTVGSEPSDCESTDLIFIGKRVKRMRMTTFHTGLLLVILPKLCFIELFISLPTCSTGPDSDAYEFSYFHDDPEQPCLIIPKPVQPVTIFNFNSKPPYQSRCVQEKTSVCEQSCGIFS